MEEQIRLVAYATRHVWRSLPLSSTPPRLEPRRLAHDAEIEQRGDRTMLQAMQRLAARCPSCLLRHAASAADRQNHTRAGRKIGGSIDGANIIAIVSVFDHKPIRHELHPFLLVRWFGSGARTPPAFWIE